VSALVLHVRPRDGEPFRQELQGEAVVLGRSSKADVVLADRFLSRQHARLFLREGSWFLEDLGSRNTTFLNDRPVAQPTPVRVGDVIRLAESRIVLEGPGGAPASPSAGDGLVGRADERLPDGTLFRSATMLFSAPAVPGEDPGGLAGRLRFLNEVHRALAAPITLEPLLELILERAFGQLKPEEGAIFLRDGSGALARVAMRRAAGVTGEPLYSRALAREVTEKGVAALVTDASEDARFAKAESIVSSGVRSLVAAPLLDSEGCLGMIVLSAKGRVHIFDENDMELLAAIASAAAMRIRSLRFMEDAAKRRLLDRELDLAHDIQMAMLPRSFPEAPGLDVSAVLRPARSVGGDLYDVMADRGGIWLLVGDVSGKGVGAALLMANVQATLRARLPLETELARLADGLDSEIDASTPRGVYLTLFLGILDVQRGLLTYVNAGHNPQFVLRTRGGISPLSSTGLPIALLPGKGYKESSIEIRPGDLLFFYTDGLVEAENEGGDMFGAERLQALLSAEHEHGIDTVLERVEHAVGRFRGSAEPFDDATMMALRIHL
jgi:sigma-B regulation protein RsbU (phosphoserine phosphatase)